jgi:CHAT domain-containing protein/tetratricopeptide (TPR) repeat protein
MRGRVNLHINAHSRSTPRFRWPLLIFVRHEQRKNCEARSLRSPVNGARMCNARFCLTATLTVACYLLGLPPLYADYCARLNEVIAGKTLNETVTHSSNETLIPGFDRCFNKVGTRRGIRCIKSVASVEERDQFIAELDSKTQICLRKSTRQTFLSDITYWTEEDVLEISAAGIDSFSAPVKAGVSVELVDKALRHNFIMLSSTFFDRMMTPSSGVNEFKREASRLLSAAIQVYGEKHEKIAGVLAKLAFHASLKGDYQATADYYARAVECWDQSERAADFDLVGTLQAWGRVLASSNQLRKSADVYRRAYSALLSTRGVVSNDTSSALLALVKVLDSEGKMSESDIYLEKAFDALEFAGEGANVQKMIVMLNFARRQRDHGNTKLAETFYRKASGLELLAAESQDELGREALSITEELADFLSLEGRTEAVEILLKEALNLLQKKASPNSTGRASQFKKRVDPNLVGKASLFISLSELYLKNGAIHKAVSAIAEARSIFATGGSDFVGEWIATYAMEGMAYSKSRETRKALELLSNAKALALKNLRGEQRERNIVLLASELGKAFLGVNDAKSAKTVLVEAQSILTKYRSSQEREWKDIVGGPGEREIRLTLAKTLFDLRDYDAALRELLVVVKITQQQNTERVSRSALGGVGPDQAEITEELLFLAANLLGKMPTKRNEIWARSFELAQTIFESSAAKSVAKSAVRAGRSPEVARLVRQLQDFRLAREDLADRIAQERAVDLRDANKTSSGAFRAQLAAIDAKVSEHEKQLCESEPSYCTLLKPGVVSPSALWPKLESDEALVFIVSMDKRTYVWTLAERKFRYDVVDLKRQELSEKVGALRCGLDEDQWFGVSRTVRCKALLGIEAPEPAAPLPFHLGIAHKLYLSLFGQNKDLLKGKRLLVVTLGPLTSLPLQVLVDMKPSTELPTTFEGYRGVAWMGRMYAISVLPSVASLLALRDDTGKLHAIKRYIGYGNPVLSGDETCKQIEVPDRCPSVTIIGEKVQSEPALRVAVSRRPGRRSPDLGTVFSNEAAAGSVLANVRRLCPLPDTGYEVRCVAERLGVPATEIRLGDAATEADIKHLSDTGELANYRVIHFATHGLLAGDVELMAKRRGEPALVLTPPPTSHDDDDDGLLTASEVSQLRLNADWVVLSACNTASGGAMGADALSGLGRAFFYAGARALLVSHWPVYSDAAVRLATETFNIAEQRSETGRASALQMAMTLLMEDESEKDNVHPAVWAPFALIGEGSIAR